MKPEHKSALTPGQREELRRTLEAKKAHLLRSIAKREDEEDTLAETNGADVGDPADLAEISIERRERLALADRDIDLLEEVDHALTRLHDGTYGVSEATGQPISYERLRAVPWARLDADEAERLERGRR
jgi:DnaK suppressor protein